MKCDFLQTRILSVFNLLKRVGFALLLLHSTMVAAQPVWQEIYQTDEDLPYCRISQIWFATPDTGFMGGHCPFTLFRSVDGGFSWEPQWEMGGDGLNDVHTIRFRDSNRGFVNFDNGFATTIDRGENWDVFSAPLNFHFGEIDYLNDTTLISAVSYSDPRDPWGPLIAHILKSEDHGHSWRIVFEREYNTDFLDGAAGHTVASTSGTVIVSLSRYRILRSIDQGESWDEINNVPIRLSSCSASPANGVFFLAGSSLRANLDRYPAIARSLDDGLTWELVWADSSSAEGAIGEISFSDSMHGWVMGSDNAVISTTDGGNTWRPETLQIDPGPDFAILSDIHVIRPDLGWVVTRGAFNPSRVIRYADTMASSSSAHHSDIPSDFEISVYPNPFNSTLSISLDVPLHQDVTLSLYDLLGREVDVIYRGRVASSTISYVAPASLSSGVYFLRAVSGKRSELVKVVLLK